MKWNQEGHVAGVRVGLGEQGVETPVTGFLQGYLAHKKPPPPLGPPQGPRHSPTVGSYGEAVSYGRGTPVALPHSECSTILALAKLRPR